MAAASSQLDDAALGDLPAPPDVAALTAEVDHLAALAEGTVADHERLRAGAAELTRIAEQNVNIRAIAGGE